MRLFIFLAALFLSGCMSNPIDMGTPPPADWPSLKVVEKRVAFSEMLEKCGSSVGEVIVALFVPVAQIPLGCARVNFCTEKCDVWLSENPSEEVVEHERLHCKGYSHKGSNYFARIWHNHKAALAAGDRCEFYEF